MRSQSAARATVVVSFAAAAAVVAIGGRSAGYLDTLWDEKVDHDIAQGLRAHPLTGEQPTLDASQMRLPMYVNAAVFAVTGRDDLRISRGVSLACAAVTVLGAAMLGRLLFGPWVGALAAVLLALSPYFLSFARIALTEGDIFAACFTTWAMWAFVRYQQRPEAGRWILCALMTALALGSKALAVVLFVVFAVLTLGVRRTIVFDPAARRADLNRLRGLLGIGVGTMVLTVAVAMVSAAAATAGWAALWVLWTWIVWIVLRRRALPRGRWARLAGMAALAWITFGALMPVHLIEDDFIRDLARRVANWGGHAPLALWRDHLRLYLGILLIKLTVPLGLLSCAGLAYAAIQARRDHSWRVCAAAVFLYSLMLCFLPLRQTFYLMGVYPLITITTAAFMVQPMLWLRHTHRWARSIWLAVVVGSVGHLAVTTYYAYPYFNLHGLALVGDRWLGAESRGYRNLIQTPSDGVESLIRWCNTSPMVRPGDRIVSYLWEDHIIAAILTPDRRFSFVPRGVRQDTDVLPPPPTIEDADFVLLHINNRLGYGDRSPDVPPPALLARQFKVVHTIRRGPMEVAWVYARR